MIGRAITTWHLSKAAVVTQNLLDMHGAGTEVAPIAGQIANRLVQKVYDERPNLFRGKEGARPHKVSTAAAALAWGVKYMGDHPEAQRTMLLALGTILIEVSGKPHQYPFSSHDHMLLALAQDIYAAKVGPDLRFAAKGYLQVAISRRHAPHIDLHTLELGYAAELLSEGCTMEQALSARWGGAYAIVDPLSNFDDAIAAYKETLAEQGIPHILTKEGVARMYDGAATVVIGVAHEADPHEYARFLRYIDQD